MDRTPNPPRTRVVTFGTFELDRTTGELRKQGLKVRLAGQPLQILLLLVDRPGELVSREEIRQRLWSADTFVDFAAGLSSAVRKVREALGDSAETSRFIETLPRRGYRFIAPVVEVRPREGAPAASASPSADDFRRRAAAILAALLVLVGGAGYFFGRAALALAPPRADDRQVHDIDPEAYRLYLKGVEAAGRARTPGFSSAIAYLEAAVRRQPDFALGYATLALAQLQLLYAGSTAPSDVVPKAEAWARKALDLDPSLALGHRTLGAILQHYYWRWEEGERELQRAAHTEPGAAETHIANASALIATGRIADAIAETERARQADPFSFNAALNLASVLRAAGQYDRALAEYRRGLALNPESARAHFQLGITHGLVSRWSEAIDELQSALRLTPDNMRFEAYLGYAYAASGQRAKAETALALMRGRRQRQYVSSFGLALVEDALGQRAAALVNIERAYDEHAVELAQLNQYPAFRAIAGEPRFAAVIEKVARPRR